MLRNFLRKTCLISLLGTGLLASAQAHEGTRWNPYYRDPLTRATTLDQESAALRQVNLRRSQIGLPPLIQNGQITTAARGHSSYLARHNLSGHYQSASQYPQGFTGTTAGDRLTGAGYSWRTYGEVISFGPATGSLGVESLIEAIYHRFGLFDPGVNEFGAGVASNHPYYGDVLTINLANQQAPATASPAGWQGMYPYDGQTNVKIDFYSDTESPDPVEGYDRVGYPISFHVGYGQDLTVNRFTLNTSNGTNVPVSLRHAANDSHVPDSAAMIIPLSPLTPGERYQVRFSGQANGASISQNWQFTTAPLANVQFSPANPCLAVGNTRNIFIVGGTAARVGWSNSQVLDVNFVSTDQLAVTALANGSATITITLADNSTASTSVTVGTTCTSSAESDSDRLFDWAEANYRHLFESPGASSQNLSGYYYRYYPVTQSYLGTKDGAIWYLDGYSGALIYVGQVQDYLSILAADGY